jgi:hypothetical protein
LNDETLRRSFEDLTLSPADFSHREHVHMAWIYLREHPLVEVLRIFPENLKRFAASIGKPGLYHETITWAYLMLIAERLERDGRGEAWDAFASRNEDLLSSSLLARYYPAEVLTSDLARRAFVWPTQV